MKHAVITSFILFCTLHSLAGFAQAPDYAREQRIADEIVPAVVVGDPVRLPGPDKRSFLGLLTTAAHPKGAVVLVHGFGVNPDWGLVGELRSHLADAGYTTLSIQMPVLAADAKADDYLALFPDAAQRIAAAVQYLQTKEYRKIALVSHSLGSRMTNEYVVGLAPKEAEAPKLNPIAAWVALGIAADYRGVEKFTFPVFDLHGENDLPTVLAGAPHRAEVLAKLPGSKSATILQSDHFYNGHYKELDAEVTAFLDQALR